MSTDAVDESPANWQVASRQCKKKVPLDIDPDQYGACAPCDRGTLPFAPTLGSDQPMARL